MLLLGLLSAFTGDEGDRVLSLTDLQTCSPHLPCRAGEHLVPFMKKLEIEGKRALHPAARWVLLRLGNFPEGLHSSGDLAECYPELKALSSIACLGSGSWSPAPVTTLYLSTLNLSLFALAWGMASCAGQELR